MTEQNQAEIIELNRARRKSCIIRLLGFWFSLMIVIIIGMVFIRSNVQRDPVAITEHVAGLFSMVLPEGFEPYSKSDFFAAHTISYWDQNHLREDGRTTSLIAIYYENKWHDWSLEKLIEESLGEMEERLERNGFHTNEKETLSFDQNSTNMKVYVYRGVTRMEEKLLDAATSYRFVMTHLGPVRIQAMGLNTDFSEASQVTYLRSITPN